MYKRYPVGSCKTELDDGNVFLYKYFLTQSQKDIYSDSGYTAVIAYGIEATCEKVLDDITMNVCTDAIECISPNKEKVMELIEFLKKHEVSPIHLVDIAGPFIDDCVDDFEEEADMIMKTAENL